MSVTLKMAFSTMLRWTVYSNVTYPPHFFNFLYRITKKL